MTSPQHAEIDGQVAPGFERVRAAFAASFAAGEEMGAGFAAILDGETVVDLWAGFADRAATRPWTRDTLVSVHSTSKPVAALIVALLQDTHGLDFEAPVAEVWPEFSAHGKDRVTIAQALAHQAGVPGFPDPIDPALWLDHAKAAAAVAALAPMWPPGTASGYHPVTWGYIAGEIARRVAGRTLGTILREDVCAPNKVDLGGVDFWIGLPDAEHARCAELIRPSRLPDFGAVTPVKQAAFLTKWAAPDPRTPEWRRAEIPSANGHGTARAVAQLYGILALGGAGVLSAASFRALTARRFFGQDLVMPFTIDWRAGVMGNNNGVYGPNREALGHSGWGGSCGLADPARKLSAGYVMNKQSHHLMGDPRALALIDALYACL